jgi:MFS family permease
MVQAFGGGAMVPVGMALVGDLYPPHRRAAPLGAIAAVDTAGWVVGHLYGGILVRFWNWRTIFWLNLPVCLVTFILILARLRYAEPPRGARRMDWAGALLITASLVLLNLGLGASSEGSAPSTLTSRGALPPYSAPALAGALLFLAAFVWRQAHAPEPLIPLTLFRRGRLAAASLANLLIGISLFIAIANVPLFINTLVAQTPGQAAWDSGWMLSALTVPMALAAIPGGWLTQRLGYRPSAVAGLLLAVGGFALMTRWHASTPYAQMLPHLLLAGVGFGLTLAPVAAAVVNASPPDQRGTASALVILFRLIGMTIGVSGITTYDLHRADVLSARLLAEGADLAEMVHVGMRAAEQVIAETFLIAGAVCALALIPVLALRADPSHRREP